LYYFGLFSLSGRWICALVTAMVASRLLRLSAGQESRRLKTRKKKLRGMASSRPLNQLHPLCRKQPRYTKRSSMSSPSYQLSLYSVLWFPHPALTRRHRRPLGTHRSPSACFLTPVLLVLSHILDLGFFYLVVVLPADGRREHRGFLLPHVLIKLALGMQNGSYLTVCASSVLFIAALCV
jgi:hypothetical protein